MPTIAIGSFFRSERLPDGANLLYAAMLYLLHSYCCHCHHLGVHVYGHSWKTTIVPFDMLHG